MPSGEGGIDRRGLSSQTVCVTIGDVTPDERFEHLESGLADVTATLRVVAGLQLSHTESLIQLTQVIDRNTDAADVRMKRIEEKQRKK